MATARSLPVFYLYGEPHRAVDEAFIHVEALDDRSRPSEWTIRRHVHVELNHLFAITSGGGVLQLDDSEIPIPTPALLVVPAGQAHGFRWQEQSAGFVITLASSHLVALIQAYPEFRGLFRQAAALSLAEAEAAAVRGWIGEMMREYSWAAPGRRAAIDAALLPSSSPPCAARRRRPAPSSLPPAVRPGSSPGCGSGSKSATVSTSRFPPMPRLWA